MKKIIFAVSALVFLVACSTVPITGRQQLKLIPSDTILTMSNDSYKEFLLKNKAVYNTEEALMVSKVGKKIANAVEKYLAQNNLSDIVKDYKWEFNLIEDKSVNAWAMPGGKVVVYTGILPVVKNETGLAVVLGHEISHVIANHGDERMSQMLVAELGGVALDVALSKQYGKTNQLFMAAYGIGAQIGVLLPYSRLQETEADRLGLIFMALAGYDPRAAVVFWKEMSEKHKGKQPPAFLSTHPSDATRINGIETFIPEAMHYYKK
ncbi:MAG: M48 family metallopeptidase [Nitrospiraceae bacterium]|nr:M48 family metallopeptidase [Nitrospiraceae bacterium]